METLYKVTIVLKTEGDPGSVLDGVLASLEEIEAHVEAETGEAVEASGSEVSVEEL